MTHSHARVTLQPAYVLHTRAYRNTSLLVEVFTPEFGRVGAVARGAKRSQSRLRGLIQPFRPLLVSWFGRGELVTLGAAEDQGAPFWFQGQTLASAFYMNELLLRLLLRGDPHPDLFRRYKDTLCRLAQTATGEGAAGEKAAALQKILRVYEKHLLQELGFGLILDRDVRSGEPIRSDRRYHYHHDAGPLFASSAAGHGRDAPLFTPHHRGVGVSGRTLIALAREQLDEPEVLREAKHLMRYLLDTHLGGRPLGSRVLIDVYGGAGRLAPVHGRTDALSAPLAEVK